MKNIEARGIKKLFLYFLVSVVIWELDDMKDSHIYHRTVKHKFEFQISKGWLLATIFDQLAQHAL